MFLMNVNDSFVWRVGPLVTWGVVGNEVLHREILGLSRLPAAPVDRLSRARTATRIGHVNQARGDSQVQVGPGQRKKR